MDRFYYNQNQAVHCNSFARLKKNGFLFGKLCLIFGPVAFSLDTLFNTFWHAFNNLLTLFFCYDVIPNFGYPFI